MKRTKTRTPQVEQLRPSLEGVGKYLTDKLYGPDGPAWGTKLAELESVLVEVREMLTEKVLAEALTRQAATAEQRPPRFRDCPDCQQPVPCTDHSPRLVTTDAGEAQWSEPEGYCRRCRRAFFPQTKSLGLDHSDYSPKIQDKIIHAAVTQSSYTQASDILAKLAQLTVSAKQVERVTKRIADERGTERDRAVAAYQALPLVERKGVPAGVTPPEVAVVSTDGGRLQVLDESTLGQRGRAIGAGLARRAARAAAACPRAPCVTSNGGPDAPADARRGGNARGGGNACRSDDASACCGGDGERRRHAGITTDRNAANAGQRRIEYLPQKSRGPVQGVRAALGDRGQALAPPPLARVLPQWWRFVGQLGVVTRQLPPTGPCAGE